MHNRDDSSADLRVSFHSLPRYSGGGLGWGLLGKLPMDRFHYRSRRRPPTRASGIRQCGPHPASPPEQGSRRYIGGRPYRGREKCCRRNDQPQLVRGNTRYPAFTILELLIVIGLIALLAALVLAAVSRAREQAKSVKCLSNLRQLGQAAFAYAQSYDGFFPISSYQNGLDWDFDARTLPVRPGILWIGSTTLAVQQCPSYDAKSTIPTDPFTGYNYNTSYIGGGVNEITPLGHPHVAPMRVTAVHDAPRIALFGDGQYYAGTDKWMRAPILMSGTDLGDRADPNTRMAGTQGYRHLGRTNVCYCDGHAESVAERHTVTGLSSGSVTDFSSYARGTGFLSLDDSSYDGTR